MNPAWMKCPGWKWSTWLWPLFCLFSTGQGLTLERNRQPPLAYYLSFNPILSQVSHLYWVSTGYINWYKWTKEQAPVQDNLDLNLKLPVSADSGKFSMLQDSHWVKWGFLKTQAVYRARTTEELLTASINHWLTLKIIPLLLLWYTVW